MSVDEPFQQGISVLLVDDEKAIRRLLQRGLEKSGLRVETAECSESLEAVLERTELIDFVLLDRSLRGSQGRSLVPRLRQALPQAKIFFFTGEHVEPREVLLVDGVIQKPVDIRALVRVIQRALNRSSDSPASADIRAEDGLKA